jgi:uncharacterized glyoxalase superfamily metalloenzyme YdcJ
MAPSATEPFEKSQCGYVHTDDLRTSFALAMSAMYKREVPLYGDLIRIVQDTNGETLAKSSDSQITALKNADVHLARLDLERHGAIRLGTPFELWTVRRVFAIIGLHPVGYYDLSSAGLPMHATCFRPISTVALEKNPFRVFTTLLRPELLQDQEARDVALDLLDRRKIFSKDLLELLEIVEKSQGGCITHAQSGVFVQEAMKTFGWRPVAAASQEVYRKLKAEHPILADIACFQSSHINHLTPRTLDIAAAQERMKAEGLDVKDRIEGPPARRCPILLRQTSFLALEERIVFPGKDREVIEGFHKARFGEIEERGAAVTLKGRKLYDRLLDEAMVMTARSVKSASIKHGDIMFDAFQQYPDTWGELCEEKLVYFTFRCSTKATVIRSPRGVTREELLAQGILEAIPIIYEDFLPLSAAGIFQSNLQSGSAKEIRAVIHGVPDIKGYENALGSAIIDMDWLYQDAQDASLRACALALGLDEHALT